MNKIPLAAYIAARGIFMYQIYLGKEVIGTADVEKQGLTYCIRCRCRISGEVAYKVIATCNGKEADLGLLVPENGAFQLTSRVPAKKLGAGELTFRAVPRHVVPDGMFIPVTVDEPFKYLSRLENAFMVRRGEATGIQLMSNSSPTGQWSEPKMSE